MKSGVLAAVAEQVVDQGLPIAPAEHARRAQQPADACQAEQTGGWEEPEGGDRAEEVEPAAPRDEVVALGVRVRQIHGEVDQEHDADEVVVEEQGRVRRLVER